MNAKVAAQHRSLHGHLDPWLLTAVVLLAGLGLVMVTSSSIAIAEKTQQDSLFYFWRHLEYLVFAVIMGAIVYRLPLTFWRDAGPALLMTAMILLLAVLVFGKTVNGSTRWLCAGGLCFQASEFAKFSLILYLAGYLVRHGDKLRDQFQAMMAPFSVLAVLGVLLILEPDFGALVVMVSTAMVLLYLSGMPRLRFLSVLSVAFTALVMFIWVSGYNVERLLSFTQPCTGENAFNSGYQLCQALIAFGQGGLWGVGLGASVQKLFYLPEAHTDFIFAVLGEELGLMGVLGVIGLYAMLVMRACRIAANAQHNDNPFEAYVAYGVGFWIAIQACISMGVNTGLMPTKGLTLPFISYGGSSLLIMMIGVALLLRIDVENQPASQKQEAATWQSPS